MITQTGTESELIYRQQAIDALDSELTITGRTNAEAVRGYVKLVKDRLERLPSATDTNVGTKLGTNLAEVGADLISRKQAIDALNKLSELTYKVNYGVVDCDDAINTIAALPSTQPKRGKWKRAYLDHESIGVRPKVLYCSECCQCIAYPTNFCPNCGADMRGKQDG